jgi:hydrogenase-4 component F
MSFAALGVSLPFAAAILAGLWGTPAQGARLNAVAGGLVFLVTLCVPFGPGAGLIHADGLGMLFGVLTGFVSFTTALSNLGFVRLGEAQLSLRRWRVYHAMCLVLVGATLLGLYADDIGLLWVAVEGATIAATLGVSLARTASALEAAWKYFILAGVGIALALFGTMLVYLAAQPALGPGLPALSFAALSAHAGRLDGALLTLAFVFLLFGYGTKAALVPLHGWLPDAYAEGPAPLTTALSGLMLNVALVAILRFRHLMQANAVAGGGALAPGPFLITLGLASLLLTGFSLPRRRDARRFFGFSSIEHSGIVAFAFGVGGVMAIFGGLLHLVLHTLVKSALFQALTRAAAMRGDASPGQFNFSRLRGLAQSNKYLAWVLAACIFTLAGLPPSGLFASEFIIISQTIQRAPWASLPLGAGLLLCAVAIIRKIGPLLFGAAPARTQAQPAGGAAYLAGMHLALTLGIGFAMPWALYDLLHGIAAGLQ